MLSAGAAAYPAPAVPALPARTALPDSSPGLNRTDQSPASPSQALGDRQSTSARAEADPSAGQPFNERSDASPRQRHLQQQQITELTSRDQAVRAHEQAHAAVGASYAGAPSYTYRRGPDGKRYAVGGEVGIDVAVVPNNPAATLRKMAVVLRAALAPAEPSAEDLRVAAQAQAQMVQARLELAAVQRSETVAADEPRAEEGAAGETPDEPAPTPRQALSSAPNLDLYRRLGEPLAPAARVDLLA
jgi:hypothetical protein